VGSNNAHSGASSKKLVDKHRIVEKKILFILLNGPVRLRDILKHAYRDSAPVYSGTQVVYWLRDNGYIQKTGKGHNDPYMITERGRRYYDCT
jgi:predicted transcriptional regulator